MSLQSSFRGVHRIAYDLATTFMASSVLTLSADISAQISEPDLNLQAGARHGVTGALSDSSSFPADTTLVLRPILVMHVPFHGRDCPRTMMMIKVIPSTILLRPCGTVDGPHVRTDGRFIR
jgi:hypothetical protein